MHNRRGERSSGAQAPSTGRPGAAPRDGPVSWTCALPRVALPNLLAAAREPKPNGVLLLLSSLSLGLLVVASLTLLRRVKRLNGGWWA